MKIYFTCCKSIHFSMKPDRNYFKKYKYINKLNLSPTADNGPAHYKV